MKKLKFTTFITAEPYVQRFSNTAPKYVLAPDKKHIVLEGQIDIDELVNSAYDSTVDRLLEQFMNVPNPRAEVEVSTASKSNEVFEREPQQSHVDELNGYHAEAERLKKQYRLSDGLTDSEVFSAVEKKLNELKEFIATNGFNRLHKNITDSNINNNVNAFVSRETDTQKNNEKGDNQQ